MGVRPTGAIYKGLTFDGVNSKNYGVYITGNAVYNAPERDVTMIEIPGRNGAFAKDNGRFSNIEVTYHAGLFGDTESDFADGISAFRNQLCSRVGYCRLTDEYNPDEYRLAVYKSGLDVDVASLEAGEFDITFECKPQRFLTSGEVATAYASGATITNPTLFASHPILQVKGYGGIEINGGEIIVANEPLGDIIIANPKSSAWHDDVTWKPEYFNSGDDIIIKGWYCYAKIYAPGISYQSKSESGTGFMYESHFLSTDGSYLVQISYEDTDHQGNAYTDTKSVTWTFNSDGGTITYTINASAAYDGDHTIAFRMSTSRTGTLTREYWTAKRESIIGESTVSSLGNPLYIDLDLGEAYQIINDVVVSSNAGVTIGAELPELAPGNNGLTYDNTFTEVKIVPRWWKV